MLFDDPIFLRQAILNHAKKRGRKFRRSAITGSGMQVTNHPLAKVANRLTKPATRNAPPAPHRVVKPVDGQQLGTQPDAGLKQHSAVASGGRAPLRDVEVLPKRKVLDETESKGPFAKRRKKINAEVKHQEEEKQDKETKEDEEDGDEASHQPWFKFKKAQPKETKQDKPKEPKAAPKPWKPFDKLKTKFHETSKGVERFMTDHKVKERAEYGGRLARDAAIGAVVAYVGKKGLSWAAGKGQHKISEMYQALREAHAGNDTLERFDDIIRSGRNITPAKIIQILSRPPDIHDDGDFMEPVNDVSPPATPEPLSRAVTPDTAGPPPSPEPSSPVSEELSPITPPFAPARTSPLVRDVMHDLKGLDHDPGADDLAEAVSSHSGVPFATIKRVVEHVRSTRRPQSLQQLLEEVNVLLDPEDPPQQRQSTKKRSSTAGRRPGERKVGTPQTTQRPKSFTTKHKGPGEIRVTRQKTAARKMGAAAAFAERAAQAKAEAAERRRRRDEYSGKVASRK